MKWIRLNKKLFRQIFLLFLGWRLTLLLISFFGLSVFPTNILTGFEFYTNTPNPDYWVRWANWDGGHFRGIVENGYLPHQIVFFPFFPMLTKALFSLNIPSLWAGLLVTHVSILIALYFFYKLIRLDYNKSTALQALFLLLAFPTSFYFGAYYSESIFLALSVSAFYFARTNRIYLAAILAGLSAITRLIGLFVILGIFVEFLCQNLKGLNFKQILQNRLPRALLYILFINIILNLVSVAFRANLQISLVLFYIANYWITFTQAAFVLSAFYYLNKYRKNLSHLKKIPIIPLVISLAPFALFTLCLYKLYGYPLAFIEYESQWNRSFTWPWQVLGDAFYRLLNYRIFTIGASYQLLVDFIFTVIFMIGLLFSLLKLRLSYSIFFAASLIMPLFSGSLIALPRYGLVLFPFFILLAQIKNPIYIKLWTYFSLILLGFFTVLYINNYWVT